MKFQRPRPSFPSKALITGGMPYGNKSLHFAHVGAVFIHADTFARFMVDRIGAENVRFVSGTDCYGSPAVASYEKFIAQGGQGSIEDYVRSFHDKQKEVLEKFQIRPNLFGASAFGIGGEKHKLISEIVFNKLYDKGEIVKKPTSQFFDEEKGVFLNGRQVIGKCPIDGCKSELAYADECGLGHQYMPSELLEPKSVLSGTTPKLVPVENWYVDLPKYMQKLADMIAELKKHKKIRQNTYNTISEFLKDPVIYVARKDHEALMAGISEEKLYDRIEDDGKKPSVTYIYDSLENREEATKLLASKKTKYRTGKTLVPFRMSGNLEWGVPVPERDGLSGLTYWVWPESLWAPVSFLLASLEQDNLSLEGWTDYENLGVYQFIGEDNVYFYGIAQPTLVMAMTGIDPKGEYSQPYYEFTELITNHHLLFCGIKAGSSSEVKPPMAEELLTKYTVDQLRMHFLGLGLSKKSVSFSPKAFNPNAMPDEADPVLKDGSVLTNVFNRLLRSCFYTSQTYFDGKIPANAPSEEIKELIEKAVLDYEQNMMRKEFHLVIYNIDDVIRKTSKYWAKHSKDGEYAQVLADTFYACKVILTLLHPITPESTENARKMLRLDESLWNWDYIFEDISVHFIDKTVGSGNHKIETIPPKYDFYAKHESQFEEDQE